LIADSQRVDIDDEAETETETEANAETIQRGDRCPRKKILPGVQVVMNNAACSPFPSSSEVEQQFK